MVLVCVCDRVGELDHNLCSSTKVHSKVSKRDARDEAHESLVLAA
jgi:hypothetical protein